MGEVISMAEFAKARAALAAPAGKNELAEIIAWLEPAEDWWTGTMQIELADSFRMVADYRRILAGAKFGRDSEEYLEAKQTADKMFHARRVQGLKQMFIKAPALRHLRWKQKWVAKHGGSSCREIRMAIARDEAALADRIAAVARQQAGKARPKAARSLASNPIQDCPQ